MRNGNAHTIHTIMKGEYYDDVYSPDEQGWYLQRHSDWQSSQIFDSAELARVALADNKIIWYN